MIYKYSNTLEKRSSVSASKHEYSQEDKQPGTGFATKWDLAPICEDFQFSDFQRSELQKESVCGLNDNCGYCHPRREASLVQKGSMPSHRSSSSIKPQGSLKLTSYGQGTFHFSTSSDKHCILWFPRPQSGRESGIASSYHMERGAQRGWGLEWMETLRPEPRFSQDFSAVVSELGQITLCTPLCPTTPRFTSITDLIQWVVNARCLQIGCDFIEECVVFFGVRQWRVLIVGFNIC